MVKKTKRASIKRARSTKKLSPRKKSPRAKKVHRRATTSTMKSKIKRVVAAALEGAVDGAAKALRSKEAPHETGKK